MAISKEIWQKAKALFEIGKSLSEISSETGIARSGISMRAKSEKWNSEKLNSIAADKVKAISNLEEIETKIEQLPSKIEQQVVQKEVDDRLAILNSVSNLQKGALNLHGIVIKKTIDGVNSGKMSVNEASKVLSNTGLKVDQIHKMNNPDAPLVQNNIQNNNTATATSINADEVKQAINDVLDELERDY